VFLVKTNVSQRKAAGILLKSLNKSAVKTFITSKCTKFHHLLINLFIAFIYFYNIYRTWQAQRPSENLSDGLQHGKLKPETCKKTLQIHTDKPMLKHKDQP
jgi:hypothetical protein